MSVVAVIPARYGSTRLAGKALLAETGKYLVQHVYEQAARASRVGRVIVATDDQRIVRAVREFGGEAQMTRADHASGTDRIAEVARGLEARVGFVLNVQGDEPEIEPESIDRLVAVMEERSECAVGTLACPFESVAVAENPNNVKVVVDEAGRALYFSRSLIPHPREPADRARDPGRWLLHLGIYAYRREFLERFSQWGPTPLEQMEKLEQLRVLERGERMAVAVVERAAVGIDTAEDYAAFVTRWRARNAAAS